MKIAVLVWDLNITGGTQRQALELAAQLQKSGHTVDVYCYIYEKERCYTELCEQVSIFSATNRQITSEKQKVGTKNKFFEKIATIFNIYKNTISSILTTNFEMKLFEELILKNHPINYYDVINIHDYQVYKVARLIQHPNIVWMMNDIQRAPLTSGNIFHRKLYNVLQYILAHKETRNISKIVVLDKRNLVLCKNTYGKDATIIRSGIDLHMFEISQQRTFKDPLWTIFASSIFFPYRRYEDLVDAIEILIKNKNTNLSVTINGLPNRAYEYYLSIQKRIEEKGLEKYIMIKTGMSETELKKQYLESDIFVFPNNNQTWGLAVFEAMLAGCACIVSRGSGAHEVLTDKENSLLVNPLSPSEIAHAIETLIRNPDEARRIAENGTRFVQENLSWEKYAKQMLSVFKNEI